MKNVSLLIMLAIILTGCNGIPNGILSQPEGKVILDDVHYTMIPSNYSWKEDDVEIRDLSSPDIKGLADQFETLEAKKGDTLKFIIDKEPFTITVTKMNEDDSIDSVELKGNKITLPFKEGYYIYELKVLWYQGKETFTFDVNVK